MANSYQSILRMFARTDKTNSDLQILDRDSQPIIPPVVPSGKSWSRTRRRWELLNLPESSRETLISSEVLNAPDGTHNEFELIENFIGHVSVPVGVAGPLRINGSYAKGDYYIPLATIEPTLIATYHRGAMAITRAGGCNAMLVDEGVIRSPGFEFKTIVDSTKFAAWVSENYDAIKETAESTTRFGKLLDMKIRINACYVFLIFEFSTGDAIGQNMVTIATQAVVTFIMSECPIAPVFFTIDANMSGDKKPCIQTFQSVRGRKVTVDTIIPRDICMSVLNVTPEILKKYQDIACIGGMSSGTIGLQGHYANGLTALYIACGQDAACCAESAVGITLMNVTPEGDLYASVTLPNIMVGTIGAVSNLPSQKACLDILGLHGSGNAAALAEVCGALCLAGDLSMCAALSVGEFTSAHKKLARNKK